MIDVVRKRSRISNLISSKEWKAQVSIWVFLFSFNDWDFFFSLALFTRLTYLGGRGGFWHLPGFLLSHAARDSNSLIASSIITIMIIPRESSSSNSSELSQEYQRKSTLCSHFAYKILIKAARPASANNTVFENQRKSLIQRCERSELRLHFE